MRATPLDDGRDQETHLGVIDPEAAPPDVALLPVGEDAAFLQRWQALEARFTEEPRRSVDDADALVAEVMERLAERFADTRAADAGVAQQRYRAFFERLLSP
jgi:hypothetical protein